MKPRGLKMLIKLIFHERPLDFGGVDAVGLEPGLKVGKVVTDRSPKLEIGGPHAAASVDAHRRLRFAQKFSSLGRRKQDALAE